MLVTRNLAEKSSIKLPVKYLERIAKNEALQPVVSLYLQLIKIVLTDALYILTQANKKGKKRKGTSFKFLVVLALEHQLGRL